MTHRPYPAYKDSGVEWLGEVPEHWEVKALGKISTEKCDGPFGSGITSEHYTDTGALVVRLQNIKEAGFVNGEPAFINLEYFEKDLFRHNVIAGDLLLAGLGDDNNLVGRACVAPIDIEPALVKADCFRFRIDRSQGIAEFVARYLCISARWDSGILSTGSTRSRIPLSVMATRLVPVPSLPEQKAITTFLERETAKIDGLVAQQERLIELLTEKRQAVISLAVTRGLDPSVPLKDSGVEWLGQVPEHWEVKRLRMVADVQTGIAKGKDNEGQTTVEVPYLRVANVQDGYLDLTEIATIEIPENDLPRYLLQPGDVLMNEGGDFDKLGRGHIWQGEIDPCIHQNHVFAVRPHGVLAEWLNAFTGSDFAQFYFKTRSKQSTNLASISSTNLMELPLVLPPLPEQQAIAAYLDEQTAQFDTLMAEAQRAIKLLKERRASIISAVVTGKIDVR